MKNMKNLFFILLAFLLIGCRDSSEDSHQLPPETQTGANTFGCLVNGRLFYPRDGTFDIMGVNKAVVYSGNNKFDEILVANFKDGKPMNYVYFHIQDLPTKGVGEYIWKESNFNNGIDGLMQNYLYIRAFDYTTNTWKWYSSYDNSGKTIITKYGGQPIVSGTFFGKLRTADGKEEIEITNGRFDINTATIDLQTFP
jgi:hypothetical protein